MKDRCTNPNNDHYRWYGAVGITYCPEWREWLNFKDWAVASGYDDNLILDRIDYNKGYSPGNCRWVTKLESAYNKRDVKRKSPLSELDVSKMLGMLSRGASHGEVSRLFKCSRTTVYRVSKGIRFRGERNSLKRG